jgi:hypothetical protein
MADQNSADDAPQEVRTSDTPSAKGPTHKSFWARSIGRLPRKAMWGAVGAVLVAIIGTVAGSLITNALGSHASVAPTAEIFYQPWTSAGKISGLVQIGSKTTGYCFTESIAAPRQDAYRCSTHNLILDPCFDDPFVFSHHVVVCAYPSPYSVTVMNLTQPLPAGVSAPTTLLDPWLIVLPDGEQCRPYTGLGVIVGGLRLNYGCQGGSLYGNVVKSGGVWKIYEQYKGSPQMVLIDIRQAFY